MASSSPAMGEPRLAQECHSTVLAASQVPLWGNPALSYLKGKNVHGEQSPGGGEHLASRMQGNQHSSSMQPRPHGSTQAAYPHGECHQRCAPSQCPAHQVSFGTSRTIGTTGSRAPAAAGAAARMRRPSADTAPRQPPEAVALARQQQASWSCGARIIPIAMECAPRCCNQAEQGRPARRNASASQIMHACISTPSLLLRITGR